MNIRNRSKIIFGSLAALLLATVMVGATFAHGGGPGKPGGPGGHSGDEVLAIVAEVLGLDVADVRTALRNGQTIAELAGDQTDEVIAALVAAGQERITTGVENGCLSEEQAAVLLSNLERQVTDLVNGNRPMFARMDRIRALRGEGLAVVAETLGLTEDEVVAALQSGQTIAELAGDQTDEVIAALVEAAEAEIAAVVESGRLSEERAATLLENLEARITAMVNGERPAGRPGGHHGGPVSPNGPLFNNNNDRTPPHNGNGNAANTPFNARLQGVCKGGNR